MEKPAGVYTKQVKELNEFAAASRTVLRHHVQPAQQPAVPEAEGNRRERRDRAIRRTNWIITNWWRPQGYYNSSEWRATWGGEGGVLVNQAPHQLDLWQWICGVPKSVYSKVAYSPP